MTAEITAVERRYQVTVRAKLSGAEPRPVPYSRQQRTYQPTIVELAYRWGSGDTEQYVDVTLHGRRVLKGNKIGAATETERLWDNEQWPGWVRDLVETNRPPADAFVRSTP